MERRAVIQLLAIARSVPAIHGIGRDDYKGFLHVDVRDKKTQWCYGPDGQQCKYYPAGDVRQS
jgi:hypothetical protein